MSLVFLYNFSYKNVTQKLSTFVQNFITKISLNYTSFVLKFFQSVSFESYCRLVVIVIIAFAT